MMGVNEILGGIYEKRFFEMDTVSSARSLLVYLHKNKPNTMEMDMYTKSRDTEVVLLKKMWSGQEVVCPKCQEAILVHLHKKAKKSNNDWKCPKCGEIYRTINMLMELPNE